MQIEIVEYWAIMNRSCKPVRFFRNEERATKAFERLRSEMKKRLFVAKYVIEVEYEKGLAMVWNLEIVSP